jgi:hypothetical protein
MALLPGEQELVVSAERLSIGNLRLIDLETGAERQLTNLGTDFDTGVFEREPCFANALKFTSRLAPLSR